LSIWKSLHLRESAEPIEQVASAFFVCSHEVCEIRHWFQFLPDATVEFLKLTFSAGDKPSRDHSQARLDKALTVTEMQLAVAIKDCDATGKQYFWKSRAFEAILGRECHEQGCLAAIGKSRKAAESTLKHRKLHRRQL